MSELRSEAVSGPMSETSDSRPEVVALAHYWPLFGLRSSTPGLVLSPLTDADLVDLMQVVPGGVHPPDQMIGLQEVSATEFAVRRTVETGSYLGLPFQGRGFGSEMRAAVTMFAFDELGAARAESAALLDNSASTRVSIKLGYQPNGQQLKERRPGEAVLSQNLLLTPDTLIRPPWTITVEGVAACRSVLGHH